MTKLKRFCATCLLVVSISAVALADGGNTQGPEFAPPPPVEQCTTGCETMTSAPVQAPLDNTTNALTLADMLVIWLVESIV